VGKKGFANIVFILGIPLLIILCVLFFLSVKTKVLTGTMNDFVPPTFSNNSPREIVDSVVTAVNNASLNLKLSNSQDGYVWWISDDNLNIIDKSAVSASLKVKSETYCGFGGNPTCAQTPVPQELNLVLKKTFEKNGFELNTLNSSKDENDVSLYDFILAYQKGETRCTLTTQNDRFYDINSDGAKQDNSAYFAYTVSCSDQFQKSYQSQRPFLVDLGIKDAVITVKHQIDNFANVNINYRRTGSFVIAKFDGKSWIKIFSGQQYPPCKLMFESGVPETVYEKCLN